jgi:hypothetical protein
MMLSVSNPDYKGDRVFSEWVGKDMKILIT